MTTPPAAISTDSKWCFLFAAVGGAIFLFLLIIPGGLSLAFWFPAGLFALFQSDEKGLASSIDLKTRATICGWLLYILLIALMLLTRKTRIFATIAIIFCILLLLNLAGCARILGPILSAEW